MTDKEKFYNTFEKLHASPNILKEIMDMTSDNKVILINRRRETFARIATFFLIAVLAIGSSTIAYVANVCGIQRIIQIWVHGDQTNAILTIDSNSYNLQYEDKDGNTIHRSGGGVALEDDGSERPLTEEELLEQIYSPDIYYDEDGLVWLYFMDQEQEITDKFVNGVCYVQLQYEDKTMYLTIKYQNGYAMSEEKYISPGEFN